MPDEGTVQLKPCPECKNDPKPECTLCFGSGKVLPDSPGKK